jgi:SAM-dependent methyltransferase
MFQSRNARLVARLHPEPTAVNRAYEIGCGTGALTRALVRALPTASVDAVDISADMLAVARERRWPERVRFTLAEFPDVDVSPGYDAVFSNAALHWTHPRYEDAFAAVARLLRPGGLFCAATAGRSPASERFEETTRRALDSLDAEDPDPFGARRLTADEVSDLAGRAGLETEDAFVVERSAEVAAGTYAEWWVSSGGPWKADEVAPDEAVRAVTEALGGAERPMTVCHTSVVAVLRRVRGNGDA